MKKQLWLAVFVLSGCAGLDGGHGARTAEAQKTVRFVEAHHRGKVGAYTAAHSWLSERYASGKDRLQQADPDAGSIVAQGSYRWSIPIDPFKLHFHEGTVDYVLRVTITDSNVELVFLTGDISGDSDVTADDIRPQLQPFYQDIRNGLMKAIAEK